MGFDDPDGVAGCVPNGFEEDEDDGAPSKLNEKAGLVWFAFVLPLGAALLDPVGIAGADDAGVAKENEGALVEAAGVDVVA